MYNEIIDEIKSFLSLIKINSAAINGYEFQGAFIKKLSNQNIIRSNVFRKGAQFHQLIKRILI